VAPYLLLPFGEEEEDVSPHGVIFSTGSTLKLMKCSGGWIAGPEQSRMPIASDKRDICCNAGGERIDLSLNEWAS
jgi:hypothetical protein